MNIDQLLNYASKYEQGIVVIAEDNIIDLTDADDFSFSAIMRIMRKKASKEALRLFLTYFKKEFDIAIKAKKQKPEKIALQNSLIKFNKKNKIKVKGKLLKNAVTELYDYKSTSEYLSNVVKYSSCNRSFIKSILSGQDREYVRLVIANLDEEAKTALRDENDADIVSNQREYRGDNRDSYLVESKPISIAPYLSVTRQYPYDPIYNELVRQNPIREDIGDDEAIDLDKNEGFPSIGVFNNAAGMQGAGPTEQVGSNFV